MGRPRRHAFKAAELGGEDDRIARGAVPVARPFADAVAAELPDV
mgnify:CR=1 FL=1